MRQLTTWSWGEMGACIADLWLQFNERHWAGMLMPCPIWFPRTLPYWRRKGKCTGNLYGQTLHIQILLGLPMQEKANVLLHEMIHQYLLQAEKPTEHNDWPWCDEVMRLSKDIFGLDIWAAPAHPRKVRGKSQRVQQVRADGRKSISMQVIAEWPQSTGWQIDIEEYIKFPSQIWFC